MSKPDALTMLVGEAHWVKTYPAGRICAHEGCNTPLSRYNPEKVCGAHHVRDDSLRFHGMAFRQCASCGTIIAVRGGATTCRECTDKARAVGA